MILMAGVVLTGCSKDPEPQMPDPAIDMPETVALPNGMNGTTTSFDITSNIDWTAEVTEGNWLTIEPEAGTGSENSHPAKTATTTTVTVTANSINSTTGTRTATITVTGIHQGAEITKTITITQPVVTGHDVYMVGFEQETKWVAKLWANGNPAAIVLSDAANQNARAHAVCVSGEEVLIAGQILGSSSVYEPALWKYNRKTGTASFVASYPNSIVANKESKPLGIATIGTDIYMAGYANNGERDEAVYWKNGVMTRLTTDALNVKDGNNNITRKGNASRANAIFVSGSDVYIAGYRLAYTEDGGGLQTTTQMYIACYWKNGQYHALTDAAQDAKAWTIFVSGNDVYVGGHMKNAPATGTAVYCPAYWKNGERTMFDPTTSASQEKVCINSIYVSGNDVYMAGTQYPGVGQGNNSLAMVWKNDQPRQLITAPGVFSTASSIAVWGANTYVLGTDDQPDGNNMKGAFWKNDDDGIRLTSVNKLNLAMGGICVAPKLPAE